MSGLDHFDKELFALDKRIGQLAVVCGADLSNPDIVVSLIRGSYSGCEHLGAVDPNHRDELRALLMMKYKIEVHCIEAMGADHCAAMIRQQDEKLRQAGFPDSSLLK